MLRAGEIIVIAIIILILFGGKKIPEFIRGLVEAIGEFKKGAVGEKEKDDGKKKRGELGS